MDRGIIGKVIRRIAAPTIIVRDIDRFTATLRKRWIRAYARYHQRLATPGRVYRIPRRRCRMWLPIAWGEAVAQRRFGLFEPLTFETLTRIIRPGFVVVELGACYGEFTIHLSQLVGPSGRIYSFEPFPPYFAIVERNIRLNTLTNVHLFNLAAGPRHVDQVQFDGAAQNPYASLDQISGLDYSPHGPSVVRPGAWTHTVECVPLSTFLAEHSIEPDLIFMDVEGCELEILGEMQGLLAGSGKRPMLYLELHVPFYGDAGLSAVHELLRKSSYVAERVGTHLLCRPQ